MSVSDTLSQIAIIGMAGRFPGAKNLAEFWQNLRNGREAISFFSEQELEAAGVSPTIFQQPHYVKARGSLADVALFDASFFNFNPREAEMLDPQHRFFLECAWEALEHAGYDAQTYPGRIGVYGGESVNTYLLFNVLRNPGLMQSLNFLQIAIGNDRDFLTTQVSHKLNLTGPSFTVQAACSTSLVAVHLACQSLLVGESDMALAGGVSIKIPQEDGYFYQEGGIMSPDGHCRAFDAQAGGTVFGNGVGMVVLKRLEDALADGDCIHAVIRSSAINNDGAAKVGYTAPGVKGQVSVISNALALAEVEPDTVTYIETHGSGTPLGDPIEIVALTQAFHLHTNRTGFCAIGSVKTNIGHLDAAAGVASLIKTVLALKHHQIPPSLNFQQANPKIDFENSPFYVNTHLTDWQVNGSPRRAGVSSFGIGGTNAHLILEEAPPVEPSSSSRPWQLLLLSTKTNSALDTATANLAQYLRQHPHVDLADVAYTYQIGRKAFEHRRMLVCHSREDALAALEAQDAKRLLRGAQPYRERQIVFMFPGLGDHYVEMAQGLYQAELVFRTQVDYCAEFLKPLLGLDLREVLYPSAAQAAEGGAAQETGQGIDLRKMLRRDGAQADELTQNLNQTRLAQPALFVVEYALAQLWLSWGIQPRAMIGYSIGEYVAACLAGVFSLDDALTIVARRSQLIQTMPTGAMLAVPLAESEILPLLNEQLSLSAVTGTTRCVVSGTPEAIGVFEQELTESGLVSWRLQTEHAFHSSLMEPVLAPFGELLQSFQLRPPQIPYLSNVTGTWINAAEATAPTYWVQHLRQPVRFAEGLRELSQEAGLILLEVGPGQTLSSLAWQYDGLERAADWIVLPSLRNVYDRQPDLSFLLGTLGKLWLSGASINWAGFYAHERRHRLPLPTYPFERQRYWLELGNGGQPSQASLAAREEIPASLNPAAPLSLHRRPQLLNDYVAPRDELEQTIATLWQKLLGVEQVGIYDSFFELGGHSLLAIQLISRLREIFPVELPLERIFEQQTVAQLAEVIEEVLIEAIERMPEEDEEEYQ